MQMLELPEGLFNPRIDDGIKMLLVVSTDSLIRIRDSLLSNASSRVLRVKCTFSTHPRRFVASGGKKATRHSFITLY